MARGAAMRRKAAPGLADTAPPLGHLVTHWLPLERHAQALEVSGQRAAARRVKAALCP